MTSPFGGYYAFRPLIILFQTGNFIPLLAEIAAIISFILIGFVISRKDITVHKSFWSKSLWAYFMILLVLFFTQQVQAVFSSDKLGIYDLLNGLILNVIIYIGILLYLISVKTKSFFWKIILIVMLTTFAIDMFSAFLLPNNYLNNHLPLRWSSVNVGTFDTVWFWLLSFPALYTIFQLSKGKTLKSK